MAAADSPASASSSTLIVPSEPNLSSDKLAQFESTTIAAGRPRPLGIKMPVPHTRLSGKGFIEPHKSNLPRRTARGRTRTRERVEDTSPTVAVRSPPPPPLNLGSPTELGFPNAKEEDDELPLETARTTRTEPPTSSMPHLSFAAATAAILSSSAADTSDRPLPHPAMGLTMGLMNAAAAAAAKRTNSPARGGLDVTPGLLSFTSPALGVQGSPIPIPIPTAYPSTPPISGIPFTPPIFGTPPLSSSIPQTPPTSSGPQVGNLPRRHRRGRAGLGLGSPVPQERRPGVGAKESLDSELASKEKQDVNIEERSEKEGATTTGPPKTIDGAEGEGDLLEPGKILKFVRLPLLQPHRQGRRTSSEEKDARERRREMSLPRTGVSAVSESPIHSRSRSRGQWRERDMSRSPLPIRNVGAGYDEAGGASSLPQRERRARVRESASRTREVRMDDLVRHPDREAASEKEEKQRKRDERRDKRCLQVIGRSAVEVGFLEEDEDDVGFDADVSDGPEDEDEETKKRKEDERKACRAGLAGGRVLVRALDVSRTQTRRQRADDKQELELELRLPTDPTRSSKACRV